MNGFLSWGDMEQFINSKNYRTEGSRTHFCIEKGHALAITSISKSLEGWSL